MLLLVYIYQILIICVQEYCQLFLKYAKTLLQGTVKQKTFN